MPLNKTPTNPQSTLPVVEAFTTIEDLEDLKRQFDEFVENEVRRLEADREFLSDLSMTGLQLSSKITRESLVLLAQEELDKIRSEGAL